MKNYFSGDVSEILDYDYKNHDFLSSFNFEKLGLFFLLSFLLKSEESMRYLRGKYSDIEFEMRMNRFAKSDYEFIEDDDHFMSYLRSNEVFDAIQSNDYKKIFKLVAECHVFYSIGEDNMSDLIESVEKEFRARLASKGGLGRGKIYQPLRERAFELVKSKNWKSKRNAVKTIKQDILELAKSLNIPLSEDQAEITITGWLTDEGLPANI